MAWRRASQTTRAVTNVFTVLLMLSNSQLKVLGVPAWHYETARAYENLFRSYGWNDKQISEATKFGANFNGTEQELVAAFKFRAAYLDAPELEQAVDAGLGLRNMIAEHLLPMPNLKRLALWVVSVGVVSVAGN